MDCNRDCELWRGIVADVRMELDYLMSWLRLWRMNRQSGNLPDYQ